MHKLDPIERLPDGSLFRLTPGQLRSVRGLTKRCCNFLDGECLLLDGVCPQFISRSRGVVFSFSWWYLVIAPAVVEARRRSLEYSASIGISRNRSARASICLYPMGVMRPSHCPCHRR